MNIHSVTKWPTLRTTQVWREFPSLVDKIFI